MNAEEQPGRNPPLNVPLYPWQVEALRRMNVEVPPGVVKVRTMEVFKDYNAVVAIEGQVVYEEDSGKVFVRVDDEWREVWVPRGQMRLPGFGL